MGVADEKRFDLLQDAFGQVVDLAAVEQGAFPQRPGMDEEERVIEEAGEKSRLQIAEREAGGHGSLSGLGLPAPCQWSGRLLPPGEAIEDE